MTARIIDGKTIAADLRGKVADAVHRLRRDRGIVPGIAVVLVGEDPASSVYVRTKSKAVAEAGMHAFDRKLPAATPEAELLALIDELNADAAVNGILVQLPLPKQIDAQKVIAAIDPGKDVDGFHPVNAGRLYLGRPNLVPGTPLGIMRMLAEYDIETEGARAVVVGRSSIVGKPMAHLLLQANATVTICHSRTVDLQRHTLDADILVAAVGQLHVIGAEMVKGGSTVIDVGMNRTENGLFGDVDPGAAEHAAYMTPVPGGVGPMTIAMVLKNTVSAARARRGLVSRAT